MPLTDLWHERFAGGGSASVTLGVPSLGAFPLLAIVWFSYDGVLEIDKDRQIHYDFSA